MASDKTELELRSGEILKMAWEAVIGLEVHVQLATDSKIFSGASNEYGAPPNQNTCEIDLGLPGALPVLNEKAVEMAVRFGCAISAEINEISIFDRKNYFYPDLPKGYQISQFENPIVGKGSITIEDEAGARKIIGITRAHLEEDAGKSVHDLVEGRTAVDLNRTGTPLLEIVSEPDIRSAQEASEYFRQIHTLATFIGICDGNLAEGSMRCDANVSVRQRGETSLGERTEIKNINSFKFLERAIELEIERQIDVLEDGGKIVRETRLFDPDKDETRSMRSKELSDDYRYFPDPDLLPLILSQEEIEKIRSELPELPQQRERKYQNKFGLSSYDSKQLSVDRNKSDFFEELTEASRLPKLSANWVNSNLSSLLNDKGLGFDRSPISPALLAEVLIRIDNGTISSTSGKTLFRAFCETPPKISEIDDRIDKMGLRQIGGTDGLKDIVLEILKEYPNQLAELIDGKQKVLGFLVGQVMKKTNGTANPKEVNEIIRDEIKKG